MSVFSELLTSPKGTSSSTFGELLQPKASTNVFNEILREPIPEPSYLAVASRSLVRTTEQLVGGFVGGGLQWAGDILEKIIPDDATIYDKAAKIISTKGQQFRQFMIRESLRGREAPDPRIWQGTFMENPSWKRATGLVAGALPTLAAAASVAIATKNPWAGGATIGAIVAPEQFAEAREVGVSVRGATGLGIARGVGEAVLESLPLRYFLSPAKMPTKMIRAARRTAKGIKFVQRPAVGQISKAFASRIFTGAAIEGTEEVAQEIWANILAKVGYDKTRSLMTGIVESFIAGAGSGGMLGGMTANVPKQLDVLKAETGVSEDEWDIILRDASKQIVQNKDGVEQVFKSLGAAAKGFAFDGFKEQINEAKDIKDIEFLSDSIGSAELVPKQKRILTRALDKKKSDLGLITVKDEAQYAKEMRKAKTLDEVLDIADKADEQYKNQPTIRKRLRTLGSEIASRLSEKELPTKALDEDALLQLGNFLRTRGVQPTYRNPKTGKITTVQKPGWKRVEEDAFITQNDLPIKQGQFGWDELAQEIIHEGRGDLFNFNDAEPGSPGDQLRIFVKDNLDKKHFITEGKRQRLVAKDQKQLAKQQRIDARLEKKRVKAEAIETVEQEKRNFNFQLNSFRKRLMELGRNPTVENRRLIAEEVQLLTQLYDKDRPTWQKKMLGKVLDSYETAHKAMRKDFTREGEKIENLIPVMLGTMRQSFVKRANLPQWARRVLDPIVQFYHYRSIRAARLFEMLDGYKHGENSKMYDWVNNARSKMLNDFNNQLRGLVDSIKNIGVDLGAWYKPNVILNDVKINQVSDEVQQKIEVENGIKEDQKSLNISSSSRGDIIIDSDFKVWLYAMLQDEGARGHLLEHGFLHDGDIIQIDAKHVSAITDSMTQQELQVYQVGRQWFNDRYAELAPVYLDIKGRPLGEIENYFPIRIDRNLLVPEALDLDKALMPIDLEADLQQRELGVEAPQYTKERTGNNYPLKGGYLNTILWYLGKSTHFINMSGAVNDVEKIIRSVDYKKMVLRTRGRGMYDNLLKWVRDVKAYDRQTIFDPVATVAAVFRRNTAVATLGLNIISSLRQSLSTFNAIAELGGPSPIMSGWQQVMFNYENVKEFVHSRSPQVRYRSVERDIEEIIRSKGSREVFGGQSRLSEKAMTLIRGMDRWTVLAVWKGAYDKTLGETGNEKEAIRRADEVVRKTQPMADLKDLPMFFRGGELTRMFTMFQNQINNNYNYWTQDILGKALSGEIETKDVAIRVLWSYMVPALIMGMINRGGPPEDLDDLAKDMITYPVAGLIFIGGIINSVIKGYSQALPLPVQQAEAFIKAFTADNPRDAMWYSARASARLLGVPGVAQAERSFKGVRDLMEGHTDDVRRLIWSEWQLRGGKRVTGGKRRRRRRRRSR